MAEGPSRVVTLSEIERGIVKADVLAAVRGAFIAHARGRVRSPMPGHLLFDEPPGDCHIKYGFREGSRWFVVKIATGFYRNAELGVPVNDGVNLVFSRRTGSLRFVLLDEGWLTSWRTAAAGALAASTLGPDGFDVVGMIGTGHQAYLQLEWLAAMRPCRRVRLWGRRRSAAEALAERLAPLGFHSEVRGTVEEVVSTCRVVFTATSSREPLVMAEWVEPGTTLVALGADDSSKQELDPALFGAAGRIVADDLGQCAAFGEIGRALEAGIVREDDVRTLGEVLIGPSAIGGEEITVVDLTGIVAQDIAITEAVVERLEDERPGAEGRAPTG